MFAFLCSISTILLAVQSEACNFPALPRVDGTYSIVIYDYDPAQGVSAKAPQLFELCSACRLSIVNADAEQLCSLVESATGNKPVERMLVTYDQDNILQQQIDEQGTAFATTLALPDSLLLYQPSVTQVSILPRQHPLYICEYSSIAPPHPRLCSLVTTADPGIFDLQPLPQGVKLWHVTLKTEPTLVRAMEIGYWNEDWTIVAASYSESSRSAAIPTSLVSVRLDSTSVLRARCTRITPAPPTSAATLDVTSDCKVVDFRFATPRLFGSTQALPLEFANRILRRVEGGSAGPNPQAIATTTEKSVTSVSFWLLVFTAALLLARCLVLLLSDRPSASLAATRRRAAAYAVCAIGCMFVAHTTGSSLPLSVAEASGANGEKHTASNYKQRTIVLPSLALAPIAPRIKARVSIAIVNRTEGLWHIDHASGACGCIKIESWTPEARSRESISITMTIDPNAVTGLVKRTEVSVSANNGELSIVQPIDVRVIPEVYCVPDAVVFHASAGRVDIALATIVHVPMTDELTNFGHLLKIRPSVGTDSNTMYASIVGSWREGRDLCFGLVTSGSMDTRIVDRVACEFSIGRPGSEKVGVRFPVTFVN